MCTRWSLPFPQGSFYHTLCIKKLMYHTDCALVGLCPSLLEFIHHLDESTGMEFHCINGISACTNYRGNPLKTCVEFLYGRDIFTKDPPVSRHLGPSSYKICMILLRRRCASLGREPERCPALICSSKSRNEVNSNPRRWPSCRPAALLHMVVEATVDHFLSPAQLL